MSRSTAFWLMALCLLAAALLRFPTLQTTPPGVHYDEAANGILAAEIGLAGYRPVFISSYTGKEPLFFYLAGIAARLLGAGQFSLRLTAAILGLLTVAVTYWAGIELLGQRRPALFASMLMAVSFWHLLFSRLGFRAISQPLLQALTIATLWRGIARRDWRYCVAGGVFLGLTAYTYLAARLFPLPLLIAFIPLLWHSWRQIGRLLAYSGIAGMVTLTPLLIYFIRFPDSFWVRISQVAPDNELAIAESYWLTLQMLFLKGDPYWRFNLPEMPLFGSAGGILLLLGWVSLLLSWRRIKPLHRAGNLLLLVTPFIMLLPTALATNEIVPSNLRAIGLIPFVFYLPALGIDALLTASQRWWSRLPRPRLTVAALVAMLLMAGTAQTYDRYFNEWGTRTDLFYETDADLQAVSDYIDDIATADNQIYVGSLHYRHPTIALTSQHYNDLKWLPESGSLPIPPQGNATYIFPHSSPAPLWLQDGLATAEVVKGPAGPDGQPRFVAYHLAANSYPLPSNQLQYQYADILDLLDVAVGTGTSGGQLPLTIAWRIKRPVAENLQLFVHFEDSWGHRWHQHESFAYPSEQWTQGETLIQQINLNLPDGVPPQFYRLRIGFFNVENGQSLALLDENGSYAGAAYIIENIPVLAGDAPATIPQPPNLLNHTVASGLQLLGYEHVASTIQSGEAINLALWWAATTPQPDLVTRIELVKEDQTGRILIDTHPVHDSYPFSKWEREQFVISRHAASVPSDFPAGVYTLRLRILSPLSGSLFDVTLGTITVEATERQFTVPAYETPAMADFGNEISLVGYTLGEIVDNTAMLTLVWQAKTQPAEDYTLFVHLLAPDGYCCPWQVDSMPLNGTYPTSRWIKDEVVVERVTIILPDELPAGSYPIEIGFYLPESGHRLSVTQPNAPVNDLLFLRPLTVP